MKKRERNSLISSVISILTLAVVARGQEQTIDFEGLPAFFHEASGAFQHGEGGVSFIQVADCGLDAERIEQAPPADPEHQLLMKT